MKLCNETITVFNAKMDGETGFDIYVPTVIRGASWHCETVSTVGQKGLEAANRFTIRIPEGADFSGKGFIPPADYAQADPDACFTLAQGDIVVHAEETDSNMTPAKLLAKYGEIVTILGVTDDRRARHAKHWKVVGK